MIHIEVIAQILQFRIFLKTKIKFGLRNNLSFHYNSYELQNTFSRNINQEPLVTFFLFGSN